MHIKLIEVPEVPKSLLVPHVIYNKLDKINYEKHEDYLTSSVNNKPLYMYFTSRVGYYMRIRQNDLYMPKNIMDWYDKDSDTIIMPNIFKSISIYNYKVFIHTKRSELSYYSPCGYTCDYYLDHKEIGFVNKDRSIEIIILPTCNRIRLSRKNEPFIDYRYNSQNNIMDQFIKGEHIFKLTI